MGRPRTVKPPDSEFFIPVNNYNRKKLEKKYEIQIPEDVNYIIPPSTLLDVVFWNLPHNGAKQDEKLLEKIYEEVYPDAD